MLVVPDQVIEPGSLLQFSMLPEDGSEPLIGPHNVFSVPLVTFTADGVIMDPGELVTVMALDMSLPDISGLVKPYPEDEEEEDLINHFSPADSRARPRFPELLEAIHAWLATETAARTGFYTAMEEGEPIPSPRTAPKAKASGPGSTTPGKASAGPKPKRHTVASLAEQVELLMGTLPQITEQLSQLAMRQEQQTQAQPSSAAQALPQPGFKAMGASKAAMPVSSMVSGEPCMNLSRLTGMLGPPPMARPSIAPATPLRPEQTLEEDEPLDPMLMAEAENLGSPMAQALLEQTKVLRTIMSHFHSTSTDPMSDLSSSTPTTGIKGTMAREKLQRDLSNGIWPVLPERFAKPFRDL